MGLSLNISNAKGFFDLQSLIGFQSLGILQEIAHACLYPYSPDFVIHSNYYFIVYRLLFAAKVRMSIHRLSSL